MYEWPPKSSRNVGGVKNNQEEAYTTYLPTVAWKIIWLCSQNHRQLNFPWRHFYFLFFPIQQNVRKIPNKGTSEICLPISKIILRKLKRRKQIDVVEASTEILSKRRPDQSTATEKKTSPKNPASLLTVNWMVAAMPWTSLFSILSHHVIQNRSVIKDGKEFQKPYSTSFSYLA